MIPLIDIHTHHKRHNTIGHIEIYNALLNVEEESKCFSIGIHPWYINNKTDQLDFVISCLENNSGAIAIGECGLDYNIEIPKDIQLAFFSAQINLAEKFKKPLIIHCVKAFNDLINLKKESKSEQAWILHGFNKSSELAKSLIKNGFYLSIGTKLSDSEKLENILKNIPIERLFFETDNDEKNKIEDIYTESARILGINLDDLKEKIGLNFNKVFNEDQ